MLKFIHFVIWVALWIGIGDSLIEAGLSMRSKAAHAFLHDQISYSKFTKILTAPEIGGTKKFLAPKHSPASSQ